MASRNKKRVKVQKSALSSKEKLRFSFEYYDRHSTKYCMSSWTCDQIRKALLRLKEISAKSFFDLRRERRVYHFTEVIWEKTIKKQGFPEANVNKLPAFHFSLLSVNDQLTRVYGAYSSGIFYIVWFDLNHEIWPSPLKHT